MSVKIALEKKFYDKVNKTESCWEWIGSKNHAGYGNIGHNGRTYRAHRMAWMMHKGDIAEGMVVCHKCDNPACVNIDHLFLGTQSQNVMDMVNKNRGVAYKGEDAGPSKLSEDKVLEIRSLYPTYSSYKLAKMYGVCRTNILSIIHRKTWNHI